MGLKHSEFLAELENAMIQFSQSGTKNVPIMNGVWNILMFETWKMCNNFQSTFFFVWLFLYIVILAYSALELETQKFSGFSFSINHKI